jgi:K+-transporting ATPase ATPase C chain
MNAFVASLRLAAATLLVCVGAYTSLVLGFARLAAPDTATGSLLTRADGSVIGSRLIAQAFTEPRWFWPRPSAVAYAADAAGGSNKSPTSPELTERARRTVAAFGATAANPLPADLAAASGSGIDPHVTEAAALFQVPRVAAARGLPVAAVEALVRAHARPVGWFPGAERSVDVLELNLALDRRP